MLNEIKEVPADTVELSNGDVWWIDNQEHVLLVYRMDPGPAVVKVKGRQDIMKLLSLFSGAYSLHDHGAPE